MKVSKPLLLSGLLSPLLTPGLVMAHGAHGTTLGGFMEHLLAHAWPALALVSVLLILGRFMTSKR